MAVIHKSISGTMAFGRAATGSGFDFQLLIYGNIGDYFWGQYVTALDVVNQIEAANVDGKRVLVRIKSRGGAVDDGVAIYDTLRASGAHITTRIEGNASSIATVFFMAGDVREIGPGGTMMIHRPWASIEGDEDDMRTAADALAVMKRSMARVYARSGMSEADIIEKYLDGKDHWLTADEAVEAGFATAITGEDADEEAQAAALAAFSTYRSAPKPMVAAYASSFRKVMAEQKQPAKPKSAPAASKSEKKMNLLVLALALGLSVAADADDDTARAALVKHFNLKDDCSDDDLAKAIAGGKEKPAPTPPDATAAASAAAQAAERTRIADVITFCAKHNADADFQAKAIKDGWSKERCGYEICNLRAEQGDETAPVPRAKGGQPGAGKSGDGWGAVLTNHFNVKD